MMYSSYKAPSHFKGLEIDTKIWVNGTYIPGTIGACRMRSMYFVGPTLQDPGGDTDIVEHKVYYWSVCLWTGLHDNTPFKELSIDEQEEYNSQCEGVPWEGRIIYEGDILIGVNGCPHFVYWSTEYLCFCVKQIYDPWQEQDYINDDLDNDLLLADEYDNDIEGCKVVGNIYPIIRFLELLINRFKYEPNEELFDFLKNV